MDPYTEGYLVSGPVQYTTKNKSTTSSIKVSDGVKIITKTHHYLASKTNVFYNPKALKQKSLSNLVP